MPRTIAKPAPGIAAAHVRLSRCYRNAAKKGIVVNPKKTPAQKAAAAKKAAKPVKAPQGTPKVGPKKVSPKKVAAMKTAATKAALTKGIAKCKKACPTC